MNKMRWIAASLVVAAGLTLVFPVSPSLARQQGEPRWATAAVAPKPLPNSALKGLDWLAAHQLESGGWGQGEESSQMGGGDQMAATANVADTCIASLALLRSGSTPHSGTYAKNLVRGIEFVLGQVEKADDESLYVTDVRGTRVQSKIGTYVDTFLASMLLSEVKGQMNSKGANERVERALNKVIAKIENHQSESGGFDNQGWAPVLSQSIAAKGLNRARQAGADVSDKALDRAQGYAEGQIDDGGKVRTEGAAGVDLYATSSNVATMQETANTYAAEKVAYEQKLKAAKTEDERRVLNERLGRIKAQEQANQDSKKRLIDRISDPGFVEGFGSNGGEEFLSYMNISEALVVEGGQQWTDWDQAMTANLSRIQNEDGSWSGHHCITGKTFCTSAAILVLTADRAPVPAPKS